MNAIVNGRILTENSELTGQVLRFSEKIAEICAQPAPGDTVIDAKGLYVSPGLIDVHIHGFHGQDASDGTPAALRTMAKGILDNGVTAFLPTTMTVPWAQLQTAFEAVRTLQRESRDAAFDGAQVLFCHAEGPFIHPDKKGAQAADAILSPDAALLLPYADVVRLVTLAPEMKGAMDCIRALTAAGIRVSMGHTTADAQTALEAVKAGADHYTHLFNAMPTLSHRAPGVVGAALSGTGYCEVICDTFHVSPLLYPMLHLCAGERLLLISDCTRAGGMPEGDYTLGGQKITVRGIECRLSDGTIAGSVLRLNDAVRAYRDHAHVPLYQAVNCASRYPARSVGVEQERGALLPGLQGDVVLFDEALRPHGVWVAGQKKR